MQRLIFQLLILFSVPCMAQFTVTQSNFPRPTSFIDTVLSSNQAGIAMPTEGADQVWDYSALTTTGSTQRVHSDATSDPVFTDALNSYQTNLSFQGFNIPITRYEAIDGNGWHVDGQSISEISYPLTLVTANPNDTLGFTERNDLYTGRINTVRFPCSYQVQWAGTHEERIDFWLTIASASLNQAPGYRKRLLNDSRDVVGYGKLLIPDFGGGVTDTMDVLQIKVFQETIDSFFLMGNQAPDSLLTDFGLTQGSIARDTFYVFYRADYSGTVLNLNIAGGAITSAFYRPQADDVLSTGLTERQWTDMQYYPNPVSIGEKLTIKMPMDGSGARKVTMLDLLGRQVSVAPLPSQADVYRLEIPAGTQPGMYIVLVTDETNTAISQLKLQVR